MTATEGRATGKQALQKNVIAAWLKKGRDGQLDLLRDPNRDALQQTSSELDQVLNEWKRLRGYVDQLQRDYTESKALDMVRRYGALKGMVKRTCMHLKVAHITSATASGAAGGTVKAPGANPSGIGAMGGLFLGTREGVKRVEQSRKREEQFKNLSSEELTVELKRMEDSLRDYRRKVAQLTDMISELDRHYEESKHNLPLQRYGLLKSMVKEVLTSALVRDN